MQDSYYGNPHEPLTHFRLFAAKRKATITIQKFDHQRHSPLPPCPPFNNDICCRGTI
jgi:hypothetical protein